MTDETWTTISIKKETFDELREKRYSTRHTASWDAFVAELLEQFDPQKINSASSKDG